MLKRFQGRVEDGRGYIEAREYHHLRTVVRLAEGDRVELIDLTNSQTFVGKIQALEAHRAVIDLDESLPSFLPTKNVTLISGAHSPRAQDFIVEKAVELGVSAVAFFHGEQTDRDGARFREDRLKRIELSARKQSGNNVPLIISNHTDLRDALAQLKQGDDVRVICLPDASAKISEFFTHSLEQLPGPVDTYLIVGPEEGFSDDEISTALKQGFSAVQLGRTTLRSETAAIVACAFVMLVT